MAIRAKSISEQLSKLSVSISQTSVRSISKKKKAKRGWIDPQFPEGHGEKIWIHSHFLDGLTVYSFSPVLRATRALKQIPFNGKKLKPAKLRKDYWRPLAMIQVPEGYGDVGQSLFQRMRELRRLRELSWGDEVLRDPKTGRTRTLEERGAALNDQKANSIADLAAILGGAGKGNRIWRVVPPANQEQVEAEPEQPQEGEPLKKPGKTVSDVSLLDMGEGATTRIDGKTGSVMALLKTQVWWANPLDRNFAKSWPTNVEHHLFQGAELEAIREQAAESGIAGGEITEEVRAEKQIAARPSETSENPEKFEQKTL